MFISIYKKYILELLHLGTDRTKTAQNRAFLRFNMQYIQSTYINQYNRLCNLSIVILFHLFYYIYIILLMKEVLKMTNVKQIRTEKGITQLELMIRCGIAQSQITQLERRQDVENLSLKTVCKIAKGLDVKIWDVINDPNVVEELHNVDEYETGIFLDGEKSPIAEIREIFEIAQGQLSMQSKIAQSQICKWERYGMDGAKVKNFIDVANALHVNMRLLIWDSDLQNLYDEVT